MLFKPHAVCLTRQAYPSLAVNHLLGSEDMSLSRFVLGAWLVAPCREKVFVALEKSAGQRGAR